jgi:serine protease Do
MTGFAAALGAQRELEALAERVRRSTVEVKAGPHGRGAGVAWGGDFVLTNAHVATNPSLTLVRHDGLALPGRILVRDEDRDLALIRVERLDLEPISLGHAGRLRPGMLAFALGHPLGVVGALSTGIVHAVGSAPSLFGERTGGRLRWLQLDLEVAPGNSGGPVLDTAGTVVGITTMIVAGLTLAVPGEDTLRWATRKLQRCRRSAS